MDLLPSPEQDEIISVVASFLRTELPINGVRLRRDQATSFDAATWAKCGDLGWFGLGLDESLGGVGYGLAEEALLFRELGRGLASGPFVGSVLGARVAAVAGAGALAASILAGTSAVGLAEGRGDVVVGDTVSGTFDLIDVAGASYVLVVGPESVALVAVSALGALPNVPSIDPGVRLSRVVLDASPTVAVVRSGSADIVARGSVLIAAMLTGIAEATRDLSAEYAKVREQFGRPIGVNQAIKHACADMALRAEAATSQLFFAACSVDESRPDAAFQVECARVVGAEGAIRNATATIQIHGGMGYTFEHDSHLFLKRARVLDRLLGTSPAHLASVLALPAPA
jgi:alkylation response protein AidB-like acyl-CoA dehydrogenase